MKRMKRTIGLAAALLALVATTAFAEVYVTNVVCAQRYPWNGMVDIDYEVVADDPDADVWVYCTGWDADLNASMAPRALTGDGAGESVKPGQHRMTWNVTADYPGFASTAFSVKMCALTGGAPYMVVDLSGGVDALEYPVEYLSSVPAGGWGDEYKTTKMAFRLIPPGTFLMGSPTGELGREGNSTYNAKESQHQVALSDPFYIGIFEVTQKQYEFVMGSNPSSSKGDMRPVAKVSYNAIRGSVNGAAWPAHNQVDANSFMGRLRSKANMMFDLPTEAQWEYACRAGTSTALNSGKDLSATGSCMNMAEVGWYTGNANQTQQVGQKLPNAWGLYDMQGNVWEWCLDWLQVDLGKSAVTDPRGPSSGNKDARVIKGGTFYFGGGYGNPESCRSASRHFQTPSAGYDQTGFRVCCLPAD